MRTNNLEVNVRSISATIIGALFASQLVACDDEVLTDDPEVEQTEQTEWSGTITGNPGWEHITGTTHIQQADGASEFMASAMISGDEPGAVRPWHVHFDTCNTGGDIVGGAASYSPLTIGSDGTATTSATVPATLDPEARYHVNIHLSPDDLPTLIACADLLIPGMDPPTEPPVEQPPDIDY